MIKRIRQIVVVGIISALLWLAWSLWTGFFVGSDELVVWNFDIGQGSAALLKSPDGQIVLFDGGPDARLLSKVGSVLPSWQRDVDLVLASHPDTDHIAGFVPLSKAYKVNTFADPGLFEVIPLENSLLQGFLEQKTEIKSLQAGDILNVGGVEIKVLSPSNTEKLSSDTNTRSLVILVTYKETSLLFMGDASTETEKRLVKEGIEPVDVLVVGHHGSISASSTEFLEATKPKWAVISAGRDNNFGHPHPVVLERLKAISTKILRTDQMSDILLKTNGKNIEINPHPLPF